MHALVDAVLAAPEDDAPRLVLADALLSRGDPRGELIVAQCALARGGLADDERDRLDARVRELLDAHAGAWCRELGLGLSPVQCRFQRGFVDGVFQLPAADLLAHGEALFGRAPIRALGIDLVGDGRLRMLEEVLGSPLLTRLHALFLRRTRIGDPGARAVASSPYLASLRTLVLTDDKVGDAGARALADSVKLAALETLDLRGNRIGDGGARAIAESRRLARLSWVALQRNRLTATGEQALARRFERAPAGVL